MVYSKARGARKPKKQKEVQNIAERDAFQEQGVHFFESLAQHPWFVGLTVAAVVVITAGALGIASLIKSSSDKEADTYAVALQAWEDAQQDIASDAGKEKELLSSVVKKFEDVAANLSGSVEGAASLVYAGRLHYKLEQYDKADEYFKKAEQASVLPKELRFGAYEGEAFVQYDQGKYKEAIAVWQRYLDEVSTDLYKDYALFYMGTAYEKSGDKEKAVAMFKRLKESYPKSLLIARIISKLPPEEPKKPAIPVIKKAS